MFEHAVALRLFLVNLLFCSKTSEVASNPPGEQPLGSHKVGLVLAVHPRLSNACCAFVAHYSPPSTSSYYQIMSGFRVAGSQDTFTSHHWTLWTRLMTVGLANAHPLVQSHL